MIRMSVPTTTAIFAEPRTPLGAGLSPSRGPDGGHDLIGWAA
jgi:hypothetical protein